MASLSAASVKRAGVVGGAGKFATACALLRLAFLCASVSSLAFERVSSGRSSPPRILLQPQGGVVYAGAQVSLRVGATNGQDLVYEWRRNDVKIRGAAGPVLALPDAQPTDNGWYEVVVYNLDGESVQSERTRLEVIPVTLGALDLAFRAAPIFSHPTNAAVPRLRAAVVQPDGKVLLGGDFERVADVPRRMIARLNSNGSLDDSFTAAQPPITGDAASGVAAMALQTDGKILVAIDLYPQRQSAVVRLNPDGSTDAGFNGPVLPPGLAVRAIGLQSDGSILVGGGHGLSRFLTNGLADEIFAVPVVSGEIQAMGVDADDSILIQGTFHRINNIDRNGIARLRPSGRLDVLFNPGDVLSFRPQAFGMGPVGDAWVGAYTPVSGMSGGPGYPGIIDLVYIQANGVPGTRFSRGGTLGLTQTIAVQTNSGALLGYRTYSWPYPLPLRTDAVLGVLPSATNGPLSAFGSLTLAELPERIISGPRGDVFVCGLLKSVSGVTLPSSNIVRLLGQARLNPEVLGVSVEAPSEVVIGQAARLEARGTGVPPFTYQWRTNGVDVGSGTNSVLIIAEAGKRHEATYTIVVRNPLAGTTNHVTALTVVESDFPRLAIAGPATGAVLGRTPPILLRAAVANAPGADRVDFLVGDQVVASLSPPGFSGEWRSAPLGSFDLTARLLSADITLATSTSVRITTTNIPPRVSLEAAIRSTQGEPNRIVMMAAAADEDGSIRRVDFLADGQTVVSVKEAPFLAEFDAEYGRKYQLSARALDNDEGISSSSEIEVDIPPLVQFRFAQAELTVSENATNVVVRVIKVGDRPGTVSYATRSKTAELGRDYFLAAGSLVFTAQERERTVVVPLANDYVADGSKEFEVALLAPAPGGILAEPKVARVIILDDDRAGGSFPDLLVPEVRAAPAGPLQVTLNPSSVTNGGWRLPWENLWRRSGDQLLGLEPWTYPVEFRPVGGYREPDRTHVAAVSSLPAALQAEYLPDPGQLSGSLVVNLDPIEALGNARGSAGWRLQGDREYFASGVRVDGVPVGRQVVEFAPVEGWTAPSPRSLWITENAEVTLRAAYSLATPGPPGAQPAVAIPNYDSILRRLTEGAQKRPAPLVGQLRSTAGFGSGIAVRERVVLTAAHVLFDEGTTNFVPEVLWFHERHRGQHEPKPVRAAGWYVFDEYLHNRQLDRLAGLSPGTASAASQEWDVAAIYFYEPIARGGRSGYLISDEHSNRWLVSVDEKAAFGYPITGSIEEGRMHEVPPGNYLFVRESGRVFSTSGFFASPGFSGAPVCVPYPSAGGYYYPAGVYLGQQGGRALVRAIDSGVADLINRAASSAELGTNFTGGGVLAFAPQVQCPLQLRRLTVRLKPEPAVAAGAAWRLAERLGAFQSGRESVVRVESERSYTVQFLTIPGWHSPPDRIIRVPCDADTTLEAEYVTGEASTSPSLVASLDGLTVFGPVGQVVEIEYSPVLPSTTWAPFATVTNNGSSTKLPDSSWSNSTNRFYRARVRN